MQMTNCKTRKVCAPPPRRAEFARLDFAIHWRICVFGLARCLRGFLSHPADDARVLSAKTQHQTNNHNRKKSMKLNRIFTVCAVAATLALSTSSLLAQNNNNGGNNGGQNGGGQNGRNRNGGGPGGGNFDPAAMQQRMVDGVRDRLGFTNDTEWAAVEPLVTKVVTARFDVGMGGGMRGVVGGRNRGGQGGGQANPEADACRRRLTTTRRPRRSRICSPNTRPCKKPSRPNLKPHRPISKRFSPRASRKPKPCCSAW